MPDFNRVVIRNVTQHDRNIHLSVHPFPLEAVIRMMETKGEYGNHFQDDPPEWRQRLADALWDALPGLTRLFFANGSITLQHSGVFSDAEIIEAATEVIQPVLAGQLLLQQVAESPSLLEAESASTYEDWTLDRPDLHP